MLTFRFRTKKSPSNQNLPNTLLKMWFPFLYSSASLDAKTWTIASNIVILKAVCRFVVLLLSTFSGFSIPGCVFFLCLWQLCSILCRPPQRSTKRSRWKKNTCLQWVTFPGHRVKYGLDYFLDHFLDHVLDHFKGGGKHTISTEGGVG